MRLKKVGAADVAQVASQILQFECISQDWYVLKSTGMFAFMLWAFLAQTKLINLQIQNPNA
jgi:hypothetical protein